MVSGVLDLVEDPVVDLGADLVDQILDLEDRIFSQEVFDQIPILDPTQILDLDLDLDSDFLVKIYLPII